ncbi:hypothetical protein H7F15_06385 [Pontibacter sp. Tf4]|uniref:hypothetical protein n=1 Tax=Pontibacter sp. Tf4 TaxID=2761620 RepID=UPI0016278221|nr:hypothetical protein [Pontibacter sp. Tf4]MBB6610657.1 hypothetical protein [Pontibacter sp. Tf4]
MKKTQNVVTLLLLWLWVAMFCFSVSLTLQEHQAVIPVSFASALQDNEQLNSIEKGTPVAWTEQSAPTTVTCSLESALQLYNFIRWAAQPVQLSPDLKPVNGALAFACATIYFRILPNGP